MIFDENFALKVAASLLQIKAIKLQPSDPFTWASGWKSPIYCDNRVILSFPEARNEVRSALSDLIKTKYPQTEVIAGVATGAIAMGVLVAQELDLPFVYVRPQPKSHGRQNQIEGHLEENAKVVVIEDLISTGGSSLKAVNALRSSGAEVLGMAAVFTYAFPEAEENFSTAHCTLTTLSDYPHLLSQAKKAGTIDEETLNTLQNWRHQPATWFVNA